MGQDVALFEKTKHPGDESVDCIRRNRFTRKTITPGSCTRPAILPFPGRNIGKKRAHCHNLMDVLDGTNPLIVYVSKPMEVHTRALIVQLLAQGKTVVVPIIEKETKTLRLSYIEDPAVLSKSTFDVSEPVGHELPAQASDVKAVIIPMLAFDKQGNRLGYGAGYYDRFLTTHPHMTRIGIAFACQELQEIPADPTDAGMDMIITDTGIIHCRCR